MKDFEQLVDHLASKGERKKVAVAWPADDHTRQAVAMALSRGVADAILVGCADAVKADERLMAHAGHIELVEAADPDQAAAKAVELVRLGKADALMKGMLNTDNLLRAVLNKEHGILPKGSVLTHLATVSIPAHHKLLVFGDAAVIPYPTPEQRHAQVAYAIALCRAIGAAEPKVGLVHCTEKTDERHFPFTADYAVIKEMAAKGEFGPCVVDGPLDLKTCLSLHALEEKGLHSPLMGDSDALIFPDIEAANAFYKTLTLFCDSENAGLLVGAQAPVVLSSRGDTARSKFYSMALACAINP